MQSLPNLIAALDYSGIALLGCCIAWQVRRHVNKRLLWGLLIGCGLLLLSCAEHHYAHAINASWALPATWACAIASTAGFSVLWVFSPQLAGTICNIARAATTDPLTGLHNRRSGTRILNCAQETAATPTGILFADIDHFKRINTELGHAGGDAALKRTAMIIKNQLRNCDFVVRWGGEEFLVILPGCQLHEASRLAQHIVIAVRGGGQCTVSIGVSCLLPGAEWEPAVNTASDRMQAAKDRGRDGVATNA